MRLVVVKQDENGASVVSSDADVQPSPIEISVGDDEATASTTGEEPALFAQLWSVESLEPLIHTRPRDDWFAAYDLPYGTSRWNLFSYGPGAWVPHHWTETVDYNLVLAGRVELVLDEVTVVLDAGDAAVVVGANHGWRTTDVGCTVAAVMLGMSDPASS